MLVGLFVCLLAFNCFGQYYLLVEVVVVLSVLGDYHLCFWAFSGFAMKFSVLYVSFLFLCISFQISAV